ncbi:type II secretion system protein [Shewanella waksmanii]|uniref:type II secretion system protein n=1 Tax=Shewanella waksmanii TaxID=213783 RepID=UPI00048DBDA5|nr:prepilin-type N-terminal cleavage/methylation domain-containing protein [Shewanella waksmanii]
MKGNQGFTLIELVVVIIVLGILAVTAAPKFINLQSDAYESTLQGMSGALLSANNLVYSKAAINGVENVESIDASSIGDEYVGGTLVYGKMQADETTLTLFVEGLDDTEAWTLEPNGTVNMRIHPAGHATIGAGAGNCFVQYSHQWTDVLGNVYPAKTTLYTDDC